LKFETETSKFVQVFAEIFIKNVVIIFQLNFFKFLAFFRLVLVVSCTGKYNKQNVKYINFTTAYHFFAIFKVSRPATLETETRPETFECETR